MTTTPLDLLREKRQEQGLPDPTVEQASWRRALLQGSLIGVAVVLVSIGFTAMLYVRQQMLKAELERLALVEAEVQSADSRLTAARSKLKAIKDVNAALVQGLVNTRSGSALMRDLQRRVPVGVQLTSVEVSTAGDSVRLAGMSIDPMAFARINAFQIELGRSPLLVVDSVKLLKAVRGDLASQSSGAPAAGATGVSFEFTAQFRPPLPAMAELQLLRELGSDGMVKRLQQLRSEGMVQ